MLTIGMSAVLLIGVGHTASAASAFECPRKEIVETLCMGPKDCLYPNVPDATTFIECTVNPGNQSGTPVVRPCPQGFHWNNRESVCDWPANAANTVETVLTASNTVASGRFPRLSATLRLTPDDVRRGVPNQTITFVRPNGTTLCTAVTNDDGRASCASTSPAPLLETYTAKYSGHRGGVRAQHGDAGAFGRRELLVGAGLHVVHCGQQNGCRHRGC